MNFSEVSGTIFIGNIDVNVHINVEEKGDVEEYINEGVQVIGGESKMDVHRPEPNLFDVRIFTDNSRTSSQDTNDNSYVDTQTTDESHVSTPNGTLLRSTVSDSSVPPSGSRPQEDFQSISQSDPTTESSSILSCEPYDISFCSVERGSNFLVEQKPIRVNAQKQNRQRNNNKNEKANRLILKSRQTEHRNLSVRDLQRRLQKLKHIFREIDPTVKVFVKICRTKNPKHNKDGSERNDYDIHINWRETE